MIDYLIKRILIMIPTYLGVTLMIWLVMTLAPGEPESTSDAGMGSAGGLGSLSSQESQGENVRIFRRQFNLDRPRFINTWTGLEPDEVREALEIVHAGVSESNPPERVKKAKRRLDDWSHYAVPSLVTLLERFADDPPLQFRTLVTLRNAAYQYRAVYAAGHKPTAEENARADEIDAENKLLESDALRWMPDADAETRAAGVAAWQRWYEERKHRWDYDTWESIKIGLTDTQFGKYWGNLFKGDLGLSSTTKEPVLGMITSRLKYSLSLAVPAFVIAWVLAVFLGVFSATHHRSATDQTIGVGLFMLYSIPTFVAALVLRRVFSVELDWFPTEGFESPNAIERFNTWEHFKDVLYSIALPLITYVYGGLAYISRQARSGMLEVLKSDFVRTARAKGLPERTVIWKHGVRNGMMPIVTLLGTALPVLIAGSVFIETVFNIDGFGNLMVTSIRGKDYNVVMGIQLIVAALTLIGLLLTDLIYAAMDPRISLK